MDAEHTEPKNPSDVSPEVDRMTNEGGPDTNPSAIPAETRSRLERFMSFAREHPRTMVIGAAGIGLFGGLEIAAAMLVGAGVAALVKLPDRAPPMAAVRDRARSMAERVRNVVQRPGSEH